MDDFTLQTLDFQYSSYIGTASQRLRGNPVVRMCQFPMQDLSRPVLLEGSDDGGVQTTPFWSSFVPAS